MISVVVPTIPERVRYLNRALAAIDATTDDAQVIVVRGQPSSGAAWREGLKQVEGDFVLLTSDDIEPQPGWWQAGVATLAEGRLPCPRVLNPDGSLQSCGNNHMEAKNGADSDVARIPFVPASLFWLLEQMPRWHYMHDYWLTDEARKIGWPTVVNRDYLFVHQNADEGRIDSLADDIDRYNKAKEEAA